MDFPAYVVSTPFVFTAPEDRSRALLAAALAADPVLARIELAEHEDHQFRLEMLDTQEVPSGFALSLQALLDRVAPLFRGAFAVTVRDCATASDDRDTVLFVGENDADIKHLKRRLAVAAAVDALKAAGVDQADPVMSSLVREAGGAAVRNAEANGTESDQPATKGEVELELVVTVRYEANGVSVDELSDNLERLVRRGVGDGLLTGPTEAEVAAWDLEVNEIPDVGHAALVDFVDDRLGEGQWAATPRLLVELATQSRGKNLKEMVSEMQDLGFLDDEAEDPAPGA